MIAAWSRLVLGVACAALGVLLTLRPFTSLAVLVGLVAATFVVNGVSELAATVRSATRPPPAALAGLAWIAAGVVVLVWAGSTIHALAVVAGISLVLGGLSRVAGAIAGRVQDRWIAVLSGVAGVIFGALALSWSDLTVLVLALLVGPCMVIFGAGHALAAGRLLTGRPTRKSGPPRPRRPRWLRGTGAVGAVALALALLAASALIHRAAPAPGSFYMPPRTVPDKPGVLLRSEPVTEGVPAGVRVWRILYTTTRDAGMPAISSGLVIASDRLPAGPRPVIAWAHGTVGIASNCAPSLLASRWNGSVIPGLRQVIQLGWILVASDYIGLGTPGPHPFLIGQGEARSVLDSVRAARQLDGVSLASQTVVWGHSQGGHAALWVGYLARSYAPDVHVIGVAAIAPASDLGRLVESVKNTLEGRVIGAYIVSAYSDIYANVSFNRYVRAPARVLVRGMATRCLDIPDAIPSVITAVLSRQPLYAADPLSGRLGERLAQNTPTGMIDVPVLVAQGLSDPLVLPSIQDRYVKQRCDAGQSLEYATYRGQDHLSIVGPGSRLVSDLLAWTKARLAGEKEPEGCRTVER